MPVFSEVFVQSSVPSCPTRPTDGLYLDKLEILKINESRNTTILSHFMHNNISYISVCSLKFANPPCSPLNGEYQFSIFRTPYAQI